MLRWTTLLIVIVAGVATSVAMILVGLPETNAAQTVLLELCALPLSVSIGCGIVLAWQRVAVKPGPRSLLVLRISGGLAGLGLVMMLAAYVVGPRDLVHVGQLLVMLGLLAGLLVVLRLQPRSATEWFDLSEIADDIEESVADVDEPSDSGATGYVASL